MMNNLKNSIRQVLQYPSAIFGSVIILALVVAAVYVIITIPYNEAIALWRGADGVWEKNPKNAPPAWINLFREEKLPESFSLDVENTDRVTVVEEDRGEGTKRITYTFTFDYASREFPQEMSMSLVPTFASKQPFVSLKWIRPDGTEERVSDFGVGSRMSYRFSQDSKLQRRLGGRKPVEGLFADPNVENGPAIPGQYQLVAEAVTFEPESNLEMEFVLYGEVYGLAGTDHLRRDLMIPLQWGIPIALAFGLLASLGTSLLTISISAFGTWYGGFVDGLIQRITEINLVLPFLSILIMVGTFYSRSIWTILGATILLSIFTGGIKTYRAIFMQIKESTYIEAAKAYGAGDFRIIFMYLLPRMIPLIIPALVSGVPAFVFLEASLAVLGLGDPVLPTWGKVINDANSNGALYNGHYYWILEPAVLLMITGFGFAMLGFALDRIFNPRLRTV